MLSLIDVDRWNKRQWGRQILAHRCRNIVNDRKGLVSIYFYDRSKITTPYVAISRLRIVVLYEDQFYFSNDSTRRTPLRFCGYRATAIPNGVQCGGADNALFFKDLMLSPNYHARGQRIELSQTFLVSLALDMDRCLNLACRKPCLRRPSLKLPRLWAGFRRRSAQSVRGDGPELELACREKGVSTTTLLRQTERDFEGLKLYPLDWVSGELECATAVFAEMARFRRPRVFRVHRFPNNLLGYSGAMEFDFYHSCYRRNPNVLSAGNSRRMQTNNTSPELVRRQLCFAELQSHSK